MMLDMSKLMGDGEKVQEVVVSMQEMMNGLRPTNMELMQAMAFILGESIAYGADKHGMSDKAIESAVNIMSQLTIASTKLRLGQELDYTKRTAN